MLPLDCIQYIITFLPFFDSIQLVSREWLTYALKKWQRYVPLGSQKWRQKLYLYSHHIIIGSKEDYWAFFCSQVIHKRKRKRDDNDELTWKAAATNYMIHGWGCRACGWPTTSNVFGIRICMHCRQNPILKHTFMLKVYQALSWTTRKKLQTIPYHGGPMNGHWRFWTDIVNADPELEDSREMRNHF